MSAHYHSIAFTDPVLDSQVRYGSRAALDRVDRNLPGPDHPHGHDGPDVARDPLESGEREFISDQDGFYMATVSQSGWPYVQFRGGAPGFVSVLDDHTLAWADFRGNRQYITAGNLDHDPRVALIFMDYARQLRLKVYGVTTVTDVHGNGPYSGPLAIPGYRARIEREIRVEVRAFDWNCPQHITARYTAEELAPLLEPLHRRVRDLEAEIEVLRAQPRPAQTTDSPTRSARSTRAKDHQ